MTGRKTTVGLVAVFGLFAVSCGSGTGTTEAADGPQSIEDLEYESPIAEFLGEDTTFDFSSDDAQAEFAAEQAAAEEAIATCMREQGFEYTPVDQSQFDFFGGLTEELPYFSDEWIAKYGFGITTQRFPQSEVGADLVGYDDSQFEDSADGFTDPNEAYIESLSPGEQEAFYSALYGQEPDLAENATEAEMEEAFSNFEPSGCQAEGWGDEFGGPGGFYEEFGDQLDDLYQRLEADPRVMEHRDKITACLADKGIDGPTDMEGLYEYFETALGDMGGGSFMAEDPLTAAGLDPTQMTDEEIDDFYRSLNALDDDDRAKLAELQAEEIELAVATVECGGGPLNDEVLLGDIRVEYEQEFLDANSDRLAEFEGSAG